MSVKYSKNKKSWIGRENKSVSVRGIFGNPAQQKFKDSNVG